MSRNSIIISEVEEFITRFKNEELVLSPESKTMTATFDEGKNWLGKPKRVTKPYCDVLGMVIARYQFQKDLDSYNQFTEAYRLLDLIQRARAFGIVRDAKKQAIQYEQQIEQLKEQLANLRTLNAKLVEENKYLHNLLPKERKGKTEVGDVSN
jgi:hypothetical protein